MDSENTKQITGAEAMLRAMLEEGVDTVFGYPGGSIIPLYDELYDYRDRINHILVRHEQGAAHAAEGYARVSGKVGVCMATSGPGATNLVTGIADAYVDSTPLVCITAQVGVNSLGTNFFQEADMISITIPVTKWSYQITSADEITEVVAKAFYIARTGRPGPVLISITKNAQVEMIGYEHKPFKPVCLGAKVKSAPVDVQVKSALALINEAERPMLLIGQGVIISGAENDLAAFAEKGNIPVASTLMGLSAMPSDHPLYAGYAGMHGNLAPNRMTQNSDLIIAVGMRFSDRVTGDTSKYAPNAKIIHIDIDKAEFNKNVRADIPILGDAKEVLQKLTPKTKHKERAVWMAYIAEQKENEYQRIISKLLSRCDGGISMAGAVDAIADRSGGEAVIVTDVGQNQMFGARYSRFAHTRSLITSGGLGTMGFGLPAAIGAKVAVPEREVVAILGDGGFQMSIQELGTIMQSGIAVKIVVLNNSFLGMVRQWQELFYNKRYSFTELANPDFIAIADAYGIKARKISQYSELTGAVDEMFGHEGPYLLEVTVECEENVFPMIPAGAALNDILLSKKAEK